MFESAMWESRVHTSKICLLFLCGMTLASTIVMLAIMDIAGLYVLIPVGITLISGSALAVVGKDAKWINNKLIFAADENALYFTSQSGDGSYFFAQMDNIRCYTAVARGKYHTVTVYFKEKENAGIRGDLKYLKMIKIERFDELKKILSTQGVAYGKVRKLP